MDIQWIAAQFPQLSGLQPLAQGGQKVVFAAQHASDGDVVLKLLLRASDEQRLEREVLAGQLVECERVADWLRRYPHLAAAWPAQRGRPKRAE